MLRLEDTAQLWTALVPRKIAVYVFVLPVQIRLSILSPCICAELPLGDGLFIVNVVEEDTSGAPERVAVTETLPPPLVFVVTFMFCVPCPPLMLHPLGTDQL